MEKTALSDEEIRALLARPLHEIMGENPDIEAIIDVWQQERIKTALARILSTPNYALLAMRYMPDHFINKDSNLYAMVAGRISPRLDMDTMRNIVKAYK